MYDQPIYTFSKDQEPLDLHKKLYVRLFKRSVKRREATKTHKIEGNQHASGEQTITHVR